jgi:hypothetical protein
MGILESLSMTGLSGPADNDGACDDGLRVD